MGIKDLPAVDTLNLILSGQQAVVVLKTQLTLYAMLQHVFACGQSTQRYSVGGSRGAA